MTSRSCAPKLASACSGVQLEDGGSCEGVSSSESDCARSAIRSAESVDVVSSAVVAAPSGDSGDVLSGGDVGEPCWGAGTFGGGTNTGLACARAMSAGWPQNTPRL